MMKKMLKDFLQESMEMLEKAGCKDIESLDIKQPPGLDIHEMGGVRIGKDLKAPLLNERNQMPLCKNVLVTDGAFMTSTGNQSPSILYMSLTAQAVDNAVKEVRMWNL